VLLKVLVTLKLQDSECNGKISTFELSTIIMRCGFGSLTIVRSLLLRLYFHSIDLFRRIVTSFCT